MDLLAKCCKYLQSLSSTHLVDSAATLVDSELEFRDIFTYGNRLLSEHVDGVGGSRRCEARAE